MRICLLGNNLTNLVLANVLASKKLNIDIYYNSNLRSQKSHTSRTLAISPENLIFLKANNKKFKISAWPSEKIKIYVESNKEKELFEFKSNSKKNFFLIKYYEIYNFYLNNLKKNNFVNFVKIKKK